MPENTSVVASLTSQFPPDKYNLLYPSESLLEISPLQKISHEIVRIDPNPANQEVFKIGSLKVGANWVDKLSLAKPALQKISHAAGIHPDTNPSQTGKVQTNDPNIITYRWTGALQKPDGSWLLATDTYTLDLEARKQKKQFDLENLVKSGKATRKEGDNDIPYVFGTPEATDYISFELRKYMIELSQFKENRAETGAQLRGVRALLGIKPWYLAAELKKPFVLVKVSLKIEFLLSNDKVKEALLLNAAQGATSVFGHGGRFLESKPQSLLVSTPVEIISTTKPGEESERILSEEEIKNAQKDEEDRIKIETQQPEQIQSQQETKKVERSAESIAAEQTEFIASWAKQPTEERLARIKTLIAKKKFVPKEFNAQGQKVATPEQMTPDQQSLYIWRLTELPDPVEETTFAMPME
jgi:hypothetical protein